MNKKLIFTAIAATLASIPAFAALSTGDTAPDFKAQASLAGKEFYQMPKPRWEGLHAIQAIAELYFITGDEKYKQAFTKIWTRRVRSA